MNLSTINMTDKLDKVNVIREPTEQSKMDMKFSTEMNRWFLTPIGIWPVAASASIAEKIGSKILVLTSFFLICFLLIPCALDTFINEKDPQLKMKMIGPMSFCLMALTKYLFLVIRKQQIRNCLEHIDQDWRGVTSPNDRNIMLKNAKLGRSIASLCAAFMYGGGFFYHTIMPFSVGSFVTPDNITIRPLTYTVYDRLVAAQSTPAYEIIFTIQWFSGFVLYSITIGACSLAAIFALHTCGQLNIVMSRLDNFIDGKDKYVSNVLEKRMAEIVELHLRALSFIVRIENILTEVCLIEFVGCTMNICFLGYYFMTEFKRAETIATVTYCVLLVSFTFNIFILCYIGEQLTQQGIKVGMTAYMIDWYKLPGKKAEGLILLLAMCKYPGSITAGKMAELSYCSFREVLKSALAYLNLLRRLEL